MVVALGCRLRRLSFWLLKSIHGSCQSACIKSGKHLNGLIASQTPRRLIFSCLKIGSWKGIALVPDTAIGSWTFQKVDAACQIPRQNFGKLTFSFIIIGCNVLAKHNLSLTPNCKMIVWHAQSQADMHKHRLGSRQQMIACRERAVWRHAYAHISCKFGGWPTPLIQPLPFKTKVVVVQVLRVVKPQQKPYTKSGLPP